MTSFLQDIHMKTYPEFMSIGSSSKKEKRDALFLGREWFAERFPKYLLKTV